MRNDNHRWTAPTPLSRVGTGVTVTEVDVGPQHFVSGPDVLTRFEGALGWPDTISAAQYNLCMRRDRVLAVGDTGLTPGYADGLAVTDMRDAFTVIDLRGPDAFTRLKTGAELRLDHPSRSVVRRVFGVDIMLCRLPDDGFRLHIPRGLSQALVELLV